VPSESLLPDPERTSQRLLVKMATGAIPVDVYEATRLWAGLSIIEEDIDGPGYLLPLGKLGSEIIVRQADPIERKRFTIAHELGHWVLGITCERKTGEFSQPPGLRHDVIEKWCDTFAATFLVPREILIDYFRDVHDPLIATHLLAAPKRFRVSEEAMFLRAYEVLGMRIAYFEPGSAKITRAFVPETVIPEIERALSLPDIRSWLHLDALALRVRIDSARFICCWSTLRGSRRVLLVLAPCSSTDVAVDNQA
jgi:Zn-dependent peptidase ImmA (M78 family)